jgi:DNA-binding transcriptional ArsR family regulator
VSNQLLPQDLPGAFCSPPQLREPLSPDRATELASMFKAVGEPVRLRLLSLIASHAGGEVCVCDLTEAFDLTQPTVSHHLKVLRSAGLVDRERRGTWVYYRVVPEVFEQLAGMLTGAPARPEAVIS